jgi:hypothetical protein
MKRKVVSSLEGVELNYVAQGETSIYWWGVHLAFIVNKGVELEEGVERWDLSSFVFPQL